MAVPKRRTSRAGTRHRRAQWKATVPVLADCPCPAARRSCRTGRAHTLRALPRPSDQGAPMSTALPVGAVPCP